MTRAKKTMMKAEVSAVKRVEQTLRREVEKPKHERRREETRAVVKVARKVSRDPASLDSTAKGKSQGFGLIEDVLTNQEVIEARYLMMLANCESFISRLPSSELAGIENVSLYSTTVFGRLACSSAGGGGSRCYAVAATDGWDSLASVGPDGDQYYNQLLSTTGDVTCLTTTGEAYNTAEAPLRGTILQTGTLQTTLPIIDPAFVDGNVRGTEYLMLCSRLSMTAVKASSDVAGVNPDAQFGGRCFVFRTSDEENSPLIGNSIETLRALAEKHGSAITYKAYGITADGLFVDESSDGEAVTLDSVNVTALPLNKEAFKWRKIGGNGSYAQPIGANVTDGTTMIAIDGISGNVFEARLTYVYQTEQIPSYMVAPGVQITPNSEAAPEKARWAFERPNPSAPTGFHGARPITDPVVPPTAYLAKGATPPVKPIVKTIPIRNPEKSPLSLPFFMVRANRNLGRTVPGIYAGLAVVSHRMTIPGLHAQMVRAGPSHGYGIGRVLAHKGAVQMAMRAGPQAVARATRSEESGEGWWSGVWSWIKGVAPELLKAGLPLLLAAL